MAAAAGFSLLKVMTDSALAAAISDNLKTLLIGNAVAFLVALASIRLFIDFLSRHGFKAFGYYRIAAGLLLFILLLFGVDLNKQ